MAKGGKLTKLKSSVLKKWHSLNRSTSSSAIAATSSFSDEDDEPHNTRSHNASSNHFPVYVGKSRRRYLVDSEVVANPIFRELVERAGSRNDEDEEGCVIACEVVLFEHLLWMLQNNNNGGESLSELVEFYAY